MHHKDQVVEVYHVSIEEQVDEAGHAKTNDEIIVPGYLKKEDRIEALLSKLVDKQEMSMVEDVATDDHSTPTRLRSPHNPWVLWQPLHALRCSPTCRRS